MSGTIIKSPGGIGFRRQVWSSVSKVLSTAPASTRPPWPPFRSLADSVPWMRIRSLDIQGSIRGRLGVAWDRVLIYATGGVAFGGINTDITVFGTDFFGTPVFGSGNRSTTRVGWTVGGGLQYAVTNNWSVRAEYRFTDFGRINQTGVFERYESAHINADSSLYRKPPHTRKPGPGRRRLQVRPVHSPAGRCEILSRASLLDLSKNQKTRHSAGFFLTCIRSLPSRLTVIDVRRPGEIMEGHRHINGKGVQSGLRAVHVKSSHSALSPSSLSA